MKKYDIVFKRLSVVDAAVIKVTNYYMKAAPDSNEEAFLYTLLRRVAQRRRFLYNLHLQFTS